MDDIRTVALTKREKQVLDLILDRNLSIDEIAQVMDIVPGTVNVFINKIYRESGIQVQSHYRRSELLNQVSKGLITFIDKPST